jgi:hypothetical protein
MLKISFFVITSRYHMTHKSPQDTYSRLISKHLQKNSKPVGSSRY